MAITRYAGDRFTIAAGETKPTGVLDGGYLIDTGNLTQFVRRTVGGTSQWTQLAGGGGGGGSPGGSNTQVQFNNAGSFGGDADLTFTNGNRLNVNKLGISGNIYDSNNSIGEGGMVLTNEGTTGVNWKSIESVLSGVGGSGVANYVARWSDEDTLTTGIIYDNAQKVGISTASPQAELHVYAGTPVGDSLLVESAAAGSSDAPDLVLYRNSPSPANSDDLGIIRFRGKNNGTDTGFGENKVIYADIEAEITSVVSGAEGAALKFYTQDNGSLASRMVITGANVGIGTDSPDAKLHVTNTTYIDVATNTGPASALIWRRLDKTIVGRIVADTTNLKTQIWDNNSAVVTIGSDQVGIGTDAPASKLHVYGSNAETTIAKIDGSLRMGVLNSYIKGPNDYKLLRFTNAGLVYNEDGAAALDFRMEGDTDINLFFSDASADKIGIGTNAPAAKLDLRSSDSVVAYIIRPSASPTVHIGSSTSAGAQLGYVHANDYAFFGHDAAFNAIVVNSSGSVGIGSTDPEEIVNVASAGAVTPGVIHDLYSTTTTRFPWIGLRKSGSNTKGTVSATEDGDILGKIVFKGVDSGSSFFRESASIIATASGAPDADTQPGMLQFATSNTTSNSVKMTINHLGYVGINTTTPAIYLHNHGSALIGRTSGTTGGYVLSSYDLVLSNGSSETAILLYNSAGAFQSSLIKYDANCLKLGLNSSNSTNAISTATAVNVGSIGVGIGTVTPGALLEIYAASSIVASHVKSGTVVSRLTANSTSSDGTVGTSSAHDFLIQRAGSTRITLSGSSVVVNDSGEDIDFRVEGDTDTNLIRTDAANERVGIGTNAPSSKLHVNSEISCGADDNNRAMFGYTPSRFYLGTRQSGTNYLNTVSVTSGKVGIGTDAPAALLNLFKTGANDAVSSAIYLQRAAGNYGAAILQVGNGSSGSEKLMFTAGHNSDPMSISNAKMTIQQDGNVGIGTTDPKAPVHLFSNGSGNTQETVLCLGSNTSNRPSLQFSENQNAGFDTGMSIEYRGDFGAGGANGLTINGLGADATTSGAAIATFLSGGSVGIGTTNPGNILHVKKSTAGTAALFEAGGTNVFVGLKESGGNFTYIGNDAGKMLFQTSGSSYSTKLIIQTDGNVGIGTVTPGSLLSVSGNSDDGDGACTIAINDEDSDAGSKLPAIQFYGGGTTQGRIRGGDTAFSIAVGSSPTTALSINTTSRKLTLGSYGGGTHTGTLAKSLGVDSSGNVIEFTGGGGTVTGSGTTNYVPKFTSSTALGNSALYDGGGSNIGIGTNNPYYALDVRFTNNTTSFSGGNSGNWGGSGLRLQNASTTAGAMALIQFRTSTTEWFIGNKFISSSPDKSDFIFNHEDSEKVRFTNDGKVGIGTATPNAGSWSNAVTIQGASSVGLELMKGSSLYAFMGVQGSGSGHALDIAAYQNQSIRLRVGSNAGTTAVTILNDGNVGIGDNSPNSRLHIKSLTDSNSVSGITIERSSTTQRGYINMGGGAFNFNVDTGLPIKFRDGGTANMTILGTGLVGIGIESPVYTLQANGTNGGIIGVTRTSGSTTGTLGHVRFGNTDIDSDLANIKGVQDGATDSARLEFETQATGGSATARLTIKSDGVVDINSAKLKINGGSGTDGQVLTTDGAGGIAWETSPGAGSVDGSGTANYVAKWSDSDTIANSVLRDDGNRLAVGAAPSSAAGILHLKDVTSNQAKMTLESANAYNSWINFSAASNEMSIGYDKSTVGGFVFANADALNSNIRMVILSGGSVGIGTNAPDVNLHIYSASSPQFRIQDSTNNCILKAYAQNSDAFVGTHSNHSFIIGMNNTTKITVASALTTMVGEVLITTGSTSVRTLSGVLKVDTIENNSGASNLKLQTESGGNKHIEITPDGTGNVGIGTATPSLKFQVHSGDILITSGKQLISTNSYTQAPPAMLTTQGPSTGATSLGTGTWGIMLGPQHTRSSVANTYYPGIAFNHLLNNGGVVTYNNHPQAWIGTRLHDTPGSERAFLVFSTKGGTGVAASDVPLERMCIDPVDGFVGIGTTNPQVLLDVYRTDSDTARFESTSTSRSTVSIRSGSGGDAQVRFQNGAASKWSIGNDGGDSDKFKIAVGSGAFSTSEAVAISTSGCVGIGTNSPLEPLHVYDGGDWQIRMSSGGARAGLVIDKPGTTTTMGSALVLSSDETYRLGTASYYHVVMTQAGVTSLLYQGNTKIATTSSGVTVTGTLTETSSITLKENVETYTPSLDIINKIRPVKYNRKTNKDKKEIGLIAEELAELFPELVEKDEKGNPSSVNYSRAVTVLLGGFKELYKEIEELKKRI